MHYITELLQRIPYIVMRSAFLLSHAMRLWLPPAPNPVEPLMLGLPVASCPGWEMIKAAAVLLAAAVVAAEYKTNDHFVRRGSQIHNGGANSDHRK